jgi:hypothetical protein
VSNDEMQSIAGVVTRVFTAKKNEEGAWMPGKLLVLTDDGEVDFIAWPMKDFDSQIVFEPMRMPPWFAALDLETIEGASVKAIAVPRVSAYSGKVEFIKVNSFKVVPTQATPREETQGDTPAPSPTPTPPSIDPNQMRIMRQSTLHYASLLMVPLVKDYDHPQTMVERTIWLAGKLLQYVISGEMPFELEVEADEPEEAPLFSDEAPDLPSLGSV